MAGLCYEFYSPSHLEKILLISLEETTCLTKCGQSSIGLLFGRHDLRLVAQKVAMMIKFAIV